MKSARLVHRLRYFFTDAWDEWRHSPGVNLLAVATLATVLFLAGLVMLVLSNVEHRVELLRQQVQVNVYLEDDITAEDRDSLQTELEAMEGVAVVEYVDKTEALRRYREWAANMADLIEELEINPLPESLDVFLATDPAAETRAGDVLTSLRGRDGIEEVRFDREWLRRLEALLDLARIGGTGLALIVFAAVMFVMASVLRLAVYARRDEIEIMLLVGATPSFVRGPFIVAGLGQGIIASALSLVVVETVRQASLAYTESGSVVLLDLLAAQPLPLNLSMLVVVVGLAVSLTSSYFAVRQSF